MRKLIPAAILMVAALFAAPAQAEFGVRSFDGQVMDNFAGDPFTQAAGHPFAASTAIDFNASIKVNGGELPDGSVKDLIVDLPAGLVGDPTATPKCSVAEFEGTSGGGSGYEALCKPNTQVGLVEVTVQEAQSGQIDRFPLYNLVPPPGTPAAFGFFDSGSIIGKLHARLRPEDNYALAIDSLDISQIKSIRRLRVTFWGVPADPAFDSLRGRICYTTPGDLDPANLVCPSGDTPADVVRAPFLTNPVDCSAGPLTTTLRARSWERPDQWKSYSFVSHLPPAYPAPPEEWGAPQGVTDCHQLTFEPGMTANPSTTAPDAPTGLDVELTFPQNESPDGIATPPLKTAKVTLPEGMTISPGGADGLRACSDEQANPRSSRPFSCPEASKVGTVTATTPLLDDQLEGGIYVGSQKSDDPASGEMFRIFLRIADAERGIDIRLPGEIRVNPATGRIETTFENNPQMPLDKLSLTFKSGPRAPLATPPTCGTKTIDAQLTSWGGQTVSRQSSFAIDCTPGLGGFSPTFSAGTARPTGGAFSPFSLSIAKPDGNAAINGLSMTLPTGLLARLKGNLGTQVGTVKAFAGPGRSPFVLPGQVYLEGQYGDAPFSLKVVVPAKAGPFDLGEVVVRQKIYVDPITAQVTVVSDPVPTIVKGVPVRLQRLEVDIDKPDFTLNPTSCAAKTIGGTINAADGQTAPINVRFQVGSCSDLALKPNLALTLSGKGQTTDGKHPAVTADLVQQAGQANLKKVRVALPLSLALDPDNANGLCEFADGSKPVPTCPKASIVGSVTATTPILDEPLSGPVYFVKNIRKDPKSGREIRTLPKLVIPLTGQNGVKLTLTGTSNVENDQLVTTFDNIPDAPVSSFKLSIIGGRGGILTVSGADICKATQVADQQIDGQNNKNADADVFIQTPSCPLKVISKKVGKTSVAVKVGGLGAGKITVSGRGIKKTSKTITKSTVATITAKRTKGEPGKVTVSYDPTGPAKAHTTTK